MVATQIGTAAWLFLFAATTVQAQSRVYPAARQGGNYMHNYYFPPAPSSTPWAPAWSPDGKWSAVAMHGSIWKVDPASGLAVELSAAKTYDSSADWSPDGKWIVYTADEDHRRIQIRMMNAETGETHALTDDDQIAGRKPTGIRLHPAQRQFQHLRAAGAEWPVGRR